MSDEKRWVTFVVGGSEFHAWVEGSVIENPMQIPEFIEVENLTRIQIVPGQIGTIKIAERGVVNSHHVGLMCPAMPDVVSAVSRAWDMVSIATPEERGRVLRK